MTTADGAGQHRSATGGHGPDGSHGPHAFVADLGAPALDAADRHHFERVVRLRPGDPLTVSDGAGGWRACRFGEELEPVGDVLSVAAPEPPVTVGFALVKGERPEWIVQKLTELGIDVIVPFVAARSVVRWDGHRAEANHRRLTKVAREASMQSRRCHLPVVELVVPFAGVAGRAGAVLADRGGEPLDQGATTVLVGPEGGWAPEERQDRRTVGLGPQVLRAETAAVAAGTLLAALRTGLVAPAGRTPSR